MKEMPLETKEKVAIAVAGAAVTGCVLGIGGYVFYLRISKKTSGFLELRREISLLRDEVEGLRKELRLLRGRDEPDRAKRVKSVYFDSASLASLTSDDDAIWFDAVDDWSGVTILPSHANGDVSPKSNGSAVIDLPTVFQKVDRWLETEEIEDRKKAYQLMKHAEQNEEFRKNSQFLWRLARAVFLYGQIFLKVDEAKRKELVFKARDEAYAALAIDPEDADIHKWCALTIGTATDFMGIKDKINYGYEFKRHIDKALELRPDDPILHHLYGRWCFGVAALSWIERKVAATVFAEPPTASYDDALKAFLEAERLKPDSWIENLLYVAKSYIAKGESKYAVPYLQSAQRLDPKSPDDADAKKEALSLLAIHAL